MVEILENTIEIREIKVNNLSSAYFNLSGFSFGGIFGALLVLQGKNDEILFAQKVI